MIDKNKSFISNGVRENDIIRIQPQMKGGMKKRKGQLRKILEEIVLKREEVEEVNTLI